MIMYPQIKSSPACAPKQLIIACTVIRKYHPQRYRPYQAFIHIRTIFHPYKTGFRQCISNILPGFSPLAVRFAFPITQLLFALLS